MKYSENWRDELREEYERLFVVYQELQEAYKKGKRLCDKPPKPSQPLVYTDGDPLSQMFISCIEAYAMTKDIRRRAFAAQEAD
ncbi:hypothetical protein IKF34_01890 [Candidatus Saccharibacteria bacterium]|nr:hypothetical protein [Candidatus Saccharibacteria bacterium]